MRGALPSLAIPYRVRVAMYWSELAAERVKIKRLRVNGFTPTLGDLRGVDDVRKNVDTGGLDGNNER